MKLLKVSQRCHQDGVFIFVHLIEGGSEISHKRHQQERNLEDRTGNEIQPLYDFVIPGGMVEIRDPGGHPDEQFDYDDLQHVPVSKP
jgi:hypothetical protein